MAKSKLGTDESKDNEPPILTSADEKLLDEIWDNIQDQTDEGLEDLLEQEEKPSSEKALDVLLFGLSSVIKKD